MINEILIEFTATPELFSKYGQVKLIKVKDTSSERIKITASYMRKYSELGLSPCDYTDDRCLTYLIFIGNCSFPIGITQLLQNPKNIKEWAIGYAFIFENFTRKGIMKGLLRSNIFNITSVVGPFTKAGESFSKKHNLQPIKIH